MDFYSYIENIRKEGAAKKSAPVLDSCGGGACRPALDGAGDYAAKDIAMRAAASIQEWCETDDLDDDETLADRFYSLMVGIIDENKDGELTDEEQQALQLVLGAAYDYLMSKGAAEEDVLALINDGDEDAAERIRDLVAGELPDGDEAEEDIDNFVFTDEDQEPAYDSCFDAVYKKTFAIRGGKKVKINKRISGTVRLSAKQKVAIRKAQMKSHSAGAMMRRLKSLKVRARMGLNKR